MDTQFFALRSTAMKHKTKSFENFYYPILTEELAAELRKFTHEELIPRIDNSVTEDKGTCVIGGGIFIRIFQNGRKKYPSEYKLLDSHFQGNISVSQSLQPVIEFLNSKYPHLNAFFYEGRMD